MKTRNGELKIKGGEQKSDAPVRHCSWLWRWLRRSVKIAVITYLAACLLVCLLQNLIIFPGAYFHNQQAATVQPAPDRETLSLWTADGQRIGAVFAAALQSDGRPYADTASRPTILFFYGNGDCINTSLGLLGQFRLLGANVLIPEYEGYPMSDGSPGEAGVYATANAAYDYLLTRPDVDPNQIVISGRSLGAAAAIDLASRRPAAGLVTFSAFTTMDAMARKILPFLPTYFFLKAHFDNQKKIVRVHCPIFMAHGTDDSLVPFSMMRRLADQAPGPVITNPVPGADHNNLFDIGGTFLMKKIGHFIQTIHTRALQ